MSNKEQSKQDLASAVMGAIKDDEVKMHSGLYFAALTALLVMSTLFVGFFAAVLVNIFVGDVRLGRDFGFDEFGPAGEGGAASVFPWGLLFLTVITVGATLLLLRRFEFSYRHKFYMFGGLGMSALAVFTLLVAVTGLAEPIQDRTPLRPLATASQRINEQFVRGVITEVINEQTFVIFDEAKQESITITVGEATFLPPNFMPEVQLEIGILGQLNEESIFEAEAVRPARKGNFRGPRRVKGLQDELRPSVSEQESQTSEIKPSSQ